MKNWLEKHLFMTRKELRGLSFLTFLSILLWFAPDIYRTFFFQPPASDLQAKAIRAIKAGEELTYDYGITLAQRHTPRLKKIWACRCGAKACTGTMLRPKR